MAAEYFTGINRLMKYRMQSNLSDRFDLSGKVAAVTGAGGALCGAMADALGATGVKVALIDIE